MSVDQQLLSLTVIDGSGKVDRRRRRLPQRIDVDVPSVVQQSDGREAPTRTRGRKKDLAHISPSERARAAEEPAPEETVRMNLQTRATAHPEVDAPPTNSRTGAKRNENSHGSTTKPRMTTATSAATPTPISIQPTTRLTRPEARNVRTASTSHRADSAFVDAVPWCQPMRPERCERAAHPCVRAPPVVARGAPRRVTREIRHTRLLCPWSRTPYPG